MHLLNVSPLTDSHPVPHTGSERTNHGEQTVLLCCQKLFLLGRAIALETSDCQNHYFLSGVSCETQPGYQNRFFSESSCCAGSAKLFSESLLCSFLCTDSAELFSESLVCLLYVKKLSCSSLELAISSTEQVMSFSCN